MSTTISARKIRNECKANVDNSKNTEHSQHCDLQKASQIQYITN